MKFYVFSICLTALVTGLLCSVAVAAEEGLPLVVSLNSEWKFAYTPDIRFQEGNEKIPVIPADDAFEARMPVPGYWDDNLKPLRWTTFWPSATFHNKRKIEFPIGVSPPDMSLPFLLGVGFYKKQIEVPSDWSGRSIVLQIGGTRMNAWVWVNRQYVGYHRFSPVPWELSISDKLKPGEKNELIIAVADIYDVVGSFGSTSGFQGLSAGIYRPVYLKVSGKARIADCYIRPLNGNAKLSWSASIDGETTGSNLVLQWAIRSIDDGKTLATGSTQVTGKDCAWTTQTYGMKPWSDHEPDLYQVELTLKDGNLVQDRQSWSFGMRTLARDGSGLKLNGRPVMMRGTCTYCDFPLTATPPSDVESYRQIIRKKKELGFNWIRFHTWVPSEEYMQAADELGMMLQVEGVSMPTQDVWREIIRTCRKHPSVVLYCCGNEVPIDEKVIEYMGGVADVIKKYAPDALFDPMECLRGVDFYVLTADTEPNLNTRRLAALKSFADVLAPAGTLSYFVSSGNWQELDKKYESYERPILIHELGIIGNYVDLDIEQRYEGTRIGTDYYAAVRKYLRETGVLPMARRYFENSCAWMAAIHKQNLETARKCKYVQGYDFLGDVNQQFHRTGYPCGIMNEFYELKPGETVDNVLKYNGESVVLLDIALQRNLVAGHDCQYQAMSSLYGVGPLAKGDLYWCLADANGSVYDRGSIGVKNIRNGSVESLGMVKFKAPQVDKPLKMTLKLRLSGGEYEVVNDWDLWVFPKNAAPNISAKTDDAIIAKFGARYTGLVPAKNTSEAGNLRVISELDQATLRFLSDGGNVVLLGSKPFPTLPTSFSPAPTGRTEGNLATVIADHPLLEGFPHEGWCSWQFRSMLEGGATVVFNDTGLPFDPIIDVASSFKYVRRQSSLFELGVGKGKLLVCTLNLDLSDPASEFMLDGILSYAASDAFQPRLNVGPDAIEKLFHMEQGPKILKVVECSDYFDRRVVIAVSA